MRLILHILTTPEDLLARQVIATQQQQDGLTIKTFDLTIPEPDYRALLQEIFAADSVQVW